jgi:homeobox protein cut-like
VRFISFPSSSETCSLSFLLVDQETLARLAEADQVTEDLERSNARVAEVERRNEKLRAEIEAVRSGSESTARYVLSPPPVLLLVTLSSRSVAALETQISDLQTEATRLLRALDTQKESFERERVELAKKVDVLGKDQGEKEREVETLRSKLQGFTDYDEIKRELEIMKVRFLPFPPSPHSF